MARTGSVARLLPGLAVTHGARTATRVSAALGVTTAPLAATGAGYGLTGLRERAELGGGTVWTGPVDREWQVCLKIPA